MNSYYDYIVVGAGIVGLTIARALSARNQNIKILIIEKESDIGCHASGRNSGVLHSGIYYQKDTLKSQVCSSGAHSMEQYCHNNDLPIKKMGKVIVPTKDQDDATLDNLVRNAEDSNLIFELIDDRRLYELEPYAKSVSGRAVYMPNVSIVEPNSVLKQILKDLKKLGVTLNFNEKLISANIDKSEITTNKSCINFGFLINAGGQYADQIAHLFHVGKQFTILPF